MKKIKKNRRGNIEIKTKNIKDGRWRKVMKREAEKNKLEKWMKNKKKEKESEVKKRIS